MTLIEQRDAYKQEFMTTSDAVVLEKLRAADVLVLLDRIKPTVSPEELPAIEEQQVIYTDILANL